MKQVPRGNWRMASSERPDPPAGGIPPQRTAAWLRTLLRALVYPAMWLDLLMQSLIRKIQPPPYRVEGGCLQRGNCCHYILMEWDPMMDRWPWLGRFWMWWYTQIHGFFVRGFDLENEDGKVARVMGCRHLQADGRCAEYRLRPAICRQWPRIEYTSKPYLLKGCGYRAIPLSAEAHALEARLHEQSAASAATRDNEDRDEALRKVQENLGLANPPAQGVSNEPNPPFQATETGLTRVEENLQVHSLDATTEEKV